MCHKVRSVDVLRYPPVVAGPLWNVGGALSAAVQRCW